MYFRNIWKIYLLSSEKTSFSIVICYKCLEHSAVFPIDLSWSNLHLMVPPIPFNWNSYVQHFFSSILGTEMFYFFEKVLKLPSERQVITNKKKVEKCMVIRCFNYCFNFFWNQLWKHLISYNGLRNINILEVAMCEQCRSRHSDFDGQYPITCHDQH